MKNLINNGIITVQGTIISLRQKSGFYKGSIEFQIPQSKGNSPKKGYIGFALSGYNGSSIDEEFVKDCKQKGIATGCTVLMTGSLDYEKVFDKNGEDRGTQPVIRVTQFASTNTTEEISKFIAEEKVTTGEDNLIQEYGKYSFVRYPNVDFFDIISNGEPIIEEIDLEFYNPLWEKLVEMKGKKAFTNEIDKIIKGKK